MIHQYWWNNCYTYQNFKNRWQFVAHFRYCWINRFWRGIPFDIPIHFIDNQLANFTFRILFWEKRGTSFNLRHEAKCLCNKRNDKFHIYILKRPAYKETFRKFKFSSKYKTNKCQTLHFWQIFFKNVWCVRFL